MPSDKDALDLCSDRPCERNLLPYMYSLILHRHAQSPHVGPPEILPAEHELYEVGFNRSLVHLDELDVVPIGETKDVRNRTGHGYLGLLSAVQPLLTW